MSDQNPPNQPPGPPPSAPPPPASSWDAPPPPPPPAAATADWSTATADPYGAGGAAPVPVAPSGAAGLLDPRWNIATGPPAGWEPKQKIVAGILGILIGSLGIHSFYLGNSKKGIIQIVASVFTCGLLGIWGFVEGIMILIGNIKTDAYGIPLSE